MERPEYDVRRAPILVLGLGDRALGDAAVGERLLELVRSRWGDDPRIEYLDGGTQGIMLADVVARRRGLLVLDGLARGREPGSVHVCRDSEDWTCTCGAAAHDGCAAEVLAAAEISGDVPSRVIVVGVEPHRVDAGRDLSPAVEAAMSEAADEAVVALGDFVTLLPVAS